MASLNFVDTDSIEFSVSTGNVSAALAGVDVDAVITGLSSATTAQAASDNSTLIAAAITAGARRILIKQAGTFLIDSTIEMDPQHNLTVLEGLGPGETILEQYTGANLEAMIATKNWLDNENPSTDAEAAPFKQRHGVVRNLGLDGNFLDPAGTAASPTIRQTSGAGHGIAFSAYQFTIDHVWIRHTRGFGIFADGTALNGTQVLGEVIEPRILNVTTERTGLAAVHCARTAGTGSDGVTDGIVDGCVFDTPNIRSSTNDALSGSDTAGDDDTNGSFVHIENGGGWVITNTHCYSRYADHTGDFQGYPGGRPRHGINVRSAAGLRIADCKVANFGQHQGTTPTFAAIKVQGNVDRPVVVGTCEVNCDEENSGATYYAVDFGTSADAACFGSISNIAWMSRATTPTIRGIRATRSGTGSWNLVVNGCNDGGHDYPIVMTDNAVGGGINMDGNSWQMRTAVPSAASDGTIPTGVRYWDSTPAAASPMGWICTVGGPGNTATFVSMPSL